MEAKTIFSLHGTELGLLPQIVSAPFLPLRGAVTGSLKKVLLVRLVITKQGRPVIRTKSDCAHRR